MKVFRLKTIGAISKEFICFIIFVSFMFFVGCQEKVQVVINKSQAEIRAQKFTGINEMYNSGGILLSRVTYKDGIARGEYWLFHDNGSVRVRGFSKEDKLHGKIDTYSSDGQLLNMAIYDNGVCLKAIYYRDGKVYQIRDVQRKIEYIYNKEGEVVSERYYGKGKE